MRSPLPPSDARQQEHLESSRNPIKFNGDLETLPYRSGDLYEGREILSISTTQTVYGWNYSLIVEGDRTHVTTRFTFDSQHDLKFTKPLEKMMPKNLRELNVPNLDS